jgi:NADH-quinone oxidoreductase subunit M
MPCYAATWLVITLGSIGVPGTGGFVGEFLVIMGTMTSARLGAYARWDAVLAALGVVLAAIYMLSLTQKMFFGPLSNEKNKTLSDLDVRETVALSPLLLLVFVVGFFPSILLNRSKDAVDAFCARYQQGYLAMAKVKDVPVLLPPFDPAHERGAPELSADAPTQAAPSSALETK